MKRRIIEFLVLAMLAVGAGPVGAAIWQWSLTPGTNATADPAINWSEGMSPSSVNDSARAMMSVIAAWRNDISGANTTAGTSTAYTLTTSEGLNTTPVTGQMVSFIAHASNGVSPTLTVDGGNTYPIFLNGAAPGAATVIIGSPYRVAFSGSAWLLEAGYGSPYNVALGGLMPSTLGTAPNSSFILPSGQCISTATYAAYWVALGSPASGACPGGQFAVIDMRGVVPAGLDNMGGVARSVLTTSANGCGTSMTQMGRTCANGNESRVLALPNLPPFTPQGTISTGTFQSSYQSRDCCGAGTGVQGQVALGPNTGSVTGFQFATITGSMTFSGSVGGGSSQAFPSVQPTVAVYYFLRVL